METIAITNGKNSETIVRFVEATIDSLVSLGMSKATAKKVLHARENGYLWGLYFTSSGKVRATYV